MQSGFDPLFPRNALRAYWKSQYLDELSDGAIDVLADRARNRPAPLTLVNVFHMGGAIAEVDPEATAFSERAAPFMVSIDGMWDDPADDADTIAWVRSAWAAVAEFGNGGVYLNFTGLADEARSAGVDTAFGAQPRAPGEGQGQLRPRQLLPRQQQHPACLATSRAARHPCRCAARAVGSGMRWTTITVFSNVCGPATRPPSRRSSSRHDAALRRVARTFVRTSTAADDVVQETWLAVVRGLSAFEGRSSLRTWIFRILVNRARTRAVRDARSLPFSALESDDRPTVEPAAFGADGRWTSAPPRLDATPRPACSAPSCASICSMPSTSCHPPSGP